MGACPKSQRQTDFPRGMVALVATKREGVRLSRPAPAAMGSVVRKSEKNRLSCDVSEEVSVFRPR